MKKRIKWVFSLHHLCSRCSFSDSGSPCRAAALFFSSLHRVIGVWSLVFNLLLCITGSWIAFTIVQSALKVPANPSSVEVVARPLVSIDEMLRKVRAEEPAFLAISGFLLWYFRHGSRAAVDKKPSVFLYIY